MNVPATPTGLETEVQSSGGILGWYTELSGKERRTFWACFTGWALDAMDVQLYSFVIVTLTALWSISRTDAGLAATATLMASSVGGWVVGVLSDRYGRVRMLQISIGFHVSLRLRQFVWPTTRFPRPAGIWVRRRVGGGSRIDRRNHPRRASGQGQRRRA